MTKKTATVSLEEIWAEDRRNPELAAELARTAVANQLAIMVIRYRVEHGLTQSALARELGMRQPAIARLEAGEHEPSVAMLARLASRLAICFSLELTPEGASLIPA